MINTLTAANFSQYMLTRLIIKVHISHILLICLTIEKSETCFVMTCKIVFKVSNNHNTINQNKINKKISSSLRNQYKEINIMLFEIEHRLIYCI